MPGTTWSRPHPCLVLIFLLSLMGCGAAGGCKSAAEAVGAPALENGCALGYDRVGIVFLRLGEGRKHCLLRQDPRHAWRTAPVWSPRHGRLFYVENRNRIAAKKLNEEQGKVIFTAPTDFGIEDWAPLAIVGDEVVALLRTDRSPRVPAQLVAVNVLDGTSWVVVTGNFDNVEAMSDTEVLVLHRVETDGTRRPFVAKVDIASGRVDDLFALPDGATFFHLSPSGGTIVTPSKDGVFYRGSVATGDFKPLDIPQVPSWASRGIFCFAGEGHILIWKQKDAMCPLGMHIVNLSTGKTRRFSWAGLDSITYVPDCSEFGDGIGGRPR